MNIRAAHPDDPPYLQAAFSKLGLSEIAGPRHEKQVLEMYAATGNTWVKDDETAWCAAYVGWALETTGLPSTRSLMARSYATYGDSVMGRKVAPRGAIAVWPRGRPPSGHVNFVLGEEIKGGRVYLVCIGGNQGNGRGGGVTINSTPKDQLVALRIPKITKQAFIPTEFSSVDREPTDRAAVTTEVTKDEEKPTLLRRIRNWAVGASSGVGALSFLAYLTDWQIAVVLAVSVFLFLGLTLVFFLWLFGKARVRDWVHERMNS